MGRARLSKSSASVFILSEKPDEAGFLGGAVSVGGWGDVEPFSDRWRLAGGGSLNSADSGGKRGMGEVEEL